MSKSKDGIQMQAELENVQGFDRYDAELMLEEEDLRSHIYTKEYYEDRIKVLDWTMLSFLVFSWGIAWGTNETIITHLTNECFGCAVDATLSCSLPDFSTCFKRSIEKPAEDVLSWKVIGSWLTLCMMGLSIFRAMCDFKMKKITREVVKGDTFVTSGQLNRLIWEVFLYTVNPVPAFNAVIPSHMLEADLTEADPDLSLYYSVDLLLLMLMPWFRLHVVFRAVRLHLGYADSVPRLLGRINNVEIESNIITMKFVITSYPTIGALTLLFGTGLLFTTLIRNCEISGDPALHIYWAESAWLTFMTMTTVGYGDLYPITFAGKMSAIFIAMFSMITSAIVIWSCDVTLGLSSTEKRINTLMQRGLIKNKKEVLAYNSIQTAWRYCYQARMPPELLKEVKNKVKWTHLVAVLKDFKKARLELYEDIKNESDTALHAAKEALKITEAVESDLKMFNKLLTQQEADSIRLKNDTLRWLKFIKQMLPVTPRAMGLLRDQRLERDPASRSQTLNMSLGRSITLSSDAGLGDQGDSIMDQVGSQIGQHTSKPLPAAVTRQKK